VEKTNAGAVILFDGICNLCNGAVQFVLRRDKQQYFRFASLQSEYGANVMKQFGLDPGVLHSILLLEGDHLYQKSEAALRIASRLQGISFLGHLRFVPAFIRDTVYDLIARFRYKIFGKKEQCMIPGPELKSRFVG
jgi:predicted DCC family thiol-disulfide oxidoreductase YuxK